MEVLKYTTGTENTTSGTITIPAPTYSAGDLIIIFLCVDDGVISSPATIPSAETITLEDSISAAEDIYCYSHVGTSTQQTGYTFSDTDTSDQITWHVIVIDGADTASAGSYQTTTATTSVTAFPTFTTIDTTSSGDNSLILYCTTTQGEAVPTMPSNCFSLGYTDNGVIASAAWYEHQATAGVTTAYSMRTFGGFVDNYAQMILVIPSGDDTLEVRCDNEHATAMCMPSNSFDSEGEEKVNLDDTITTINGLDTQDSSVSGVTLQGQNSVFVDGLDSGVVAMGSSAQSSALDGDLILAAIPLPSDRDFSGKLLSLNYWWSGRATLRDYGEYASYFGLYDNTNGNLITWEIKSGNTIPNIKSKTGILIDVDAELTAVKDNDITGGSSTDWDTDNSSTQVSHCLFGKRIQSGVSTQYLNIAPVFAIETMKLVGGNSTRPVNFKSAVELAKTCYLNTFQSQQEQATGQFYGTQSLQFGNGTDKTVWDITNQSIEYPRALNESEFEIQSRINSAALSFIVDSSGTGSSGTASNATFNMGDYHNWTHTSGTITGAFTVLNATVTLNSSGSYASGTKFSGCKEITHNSADLTGVTIDNVASGETAAISISAAGQTALQTALDNLLGASFTNNTNAPAIQITNTSNGATTLNITNTTFSGNTYDILWNSNDNSALTINLDAASVGADAYDPSGDAVTFQSAPISVTINSNVAATIRLFADSSTQTAITPTSSTSTSITYEFTGTQNYYYTVDAKGYIPQRGFTGSITASYSTTVNLVADPVYNSTHGLTWSTNTTLAANEFHFDDTNKVLYLNENQEGRDVYSAMIDAWFDGETEILNRPFPLKAIGIDRIDFLSDGTTGATIDSGDIQYWKGAGMEWEHDTTGNATRKFYSIKSSNTLQAGTVVGYTQVNNGTPAECTLVSNQVNQVIQYYEDTNGDGTSDYNYNSHLLFKAFLTGYYQSRWDVVNDGGATLESYEYTISLVQDAIAGISGNQSIIITTLTDHSASPIDPATTLDYFNFELVDPASSTAAQLLAQVNYDIYTAVNTSISGNVYTSYQAFDVPDLIVEAGSTYETEAGYFEGEDLVTDREGVYVSRSAADHPGFTRFQSNDLSYYTPTVTANISVSNLTDSGATTRLQIYNVTAQSAAVWQATTAYAVGDIVKKVAGFDTTDTAGYFFRCISAGTSGGTEPTWVTTTRQNVDNTTGSETTDGTVTWLCCSILFYDKDPAATSASPTYIDGEEFKNGESARIRYADMNGATSFEYGQTVTSVATTGFSVDGNNFISADSIYATNAVNGTTVSIFTPDYDELEVDVASDTDFTAATFYAFYCYELTQSDGMYYFWGGITANDTGNYKINASVVSIYFESPTGVTYNIKQTDSARIYRDDDAYPVRDPSESGYGVQINWKNQVYVVSTGGSALTPSEQAQLTAIESKTSSLTYNGTNVNANVVEMNEAEVAGTGISSDLWRGVE